MQGNCLKKNRCYEALCIPETLNQTVIAKSKKKDQSIVDLMKRNDAGNKWIQKDQHYPMVWKENQFTMMHQRKDTRLCRFELVESLLTAGILISKAKIWGLFLKKWPLSDILSSFLNELIPLILKKEKDCVKSEVGTGDNFSVIFDGSTRLSEALAIVVRFIDNQWPLQPRLVKLDVLAKSMNAEELAKRLTQCLAVECMIRPDQLLASMRDGAALNEACLRQIRFFFPNMFNVTCFSHTIDWIWLNLVYWTHFLGTGKPCSQPSCPHNMENKDKNCNASNLRNEVVE